MLTIMRHANQCEIYGGISEYIQNDTMNAVYEFVAKYFSMLYSDSYITNKLIRNPGKIIFQIITPSDISYPISR